MQLALVCLASAGLLLALWALLSTRRLTRKLEDLTRSYWELRYDYTRLRSQVARLDPEQQAVENPEASLPTAVAFVPLSSLRPGQPKDR
jgi:hypothetical protein